MPFMSPIKAAHILVKIATRYTKMSYSQKQKIRRKGLHGFNSPEEVCLEWIGLEMSMSGMSAQGKLVYNIGTAQMKVHTWRQDTMSVRANIDVWFKGTSLKWKIHVWPIKGYMIWYDCNRWIARTPLYPYGRYWEWRSEAHVEFKSKGTSTNYGIKVDRTCQSGQWKAGAG